MGEAGSGKSTIASRVVERLHSCFKHTAIASYDGSVKQTLASIANQLEIPIINDKDKQLSNDEAKEEIAINCNSNILIVVDNAHRWTPSLRYWLEVLHSKGAVLLLLALDDIEKDIFLRLLKLELPAPTLSQIREVMYREALALDFELNPSRFAHLQQLAGTNLMLAKKVVAEASLGMHSKSIEHKQYVDISSFVNAAIALLGIIRFIGLGTGDQTLYIFGGVIVLISISFRYLGRGLSQKQRRLGR